MNERKIYSFEDKGLSFTKETIMSASLDNDTWQRVLYNKSMNIRECISCSNGVVELEIDPLSVYFVN